VTQKYNQPEITEDNYLFRLDSLTQNKADIQQKNWKDYFKDSLLIQYIDSALIYNQDNLIAFKNIELFQAQYKQSKAAFYPTLNLEGNIQDSKLANTPSSQDFTQYTLGANVSWEADLWGKIKSQKLANRAQFQQSTTAQKLVQTQLISNIATTYFQLLEADKRKAIIEQSVQLRKESVFTLENLKTAGLSNSLAVNQAKAQLSQSEILLTSVNNQIFSLENALVTLVGKSFYQFKRLHLDFQNQENLQFSEVPLQLLENRPDVKVAELEFASFFQNFNVAKSSMYPTIRLTAGTGLQSNDASTLFSANSLFSNLIGGITAPIFNGRALKTRKEVSKIHMEQSLLRFQKTVLLASIEISNLQKSIQTHRSNLEYLNTQEELLMGSYLDARDLLKAGLANYLEVLNAQENLLNIQTQKVNTELQILQNQALLFKAIGGGVN
jgi:NodT family efflux transporter outer membrane factor (OMF) lipoprotein